MDFLHYKREVFHKIPKLLWLDKASLSKSLMILSRMMMSQTAWLALSFWQTVVSIFSLSGTVLPATLAQYVQT